jgi:hypothetical protein
MISFAESNGQVRRSPVSYPRMWTFMSNTKAVKTGNLNSFS